MKAFPFLEPSESSQLPVNAVFAITVNISQGQSFDHAGLYLPEAVFIWLNVIRLKRKEIRDILKFMFRANIVKAMRLHMIERFK